MSIKYNAEARKKIKEDICQRLDNALNVNELGGKGNVAIWKVLRFILDNYNTATFYGFINIKLEGTAIKEPKITDQSFKVETMYDDF